MRPLDERLVARSLSSALFDLGFLGIFEQWRAQNSFQLRLRSTTDLQYRGVISNQSTNAIDGE